MPTFEAALAAASTLGAEHAQLDKRISGMLVAEDHDPAWTAADSATLDQAVARRAELAKALEATFASIAREHGSAWRAYLVESADRLRVLSRSNDGDRFAAQGVLYHLDRWLQGDADADRPKAFGGGPLLAKHQQLIDDLLRAGR